MSGVVGIDPSLNSLGFAYRVKGTPRAVCVGSDNRKGIDRIRYMRDKVAAHLDNYQPELVVYEGFALGFRGKSNIIFDLGELGGVLKLLILDLGIDILLVPPNNLKMFTTGKGNADKEHVSLAVGQALNVSFSTSDQYDAAGLLMMGEAFLNSRLLSRDRKHHTRKALAGCVFLQAD